MKTPTCRFAKSAFVVKDGWRYNRNGKKRRWLCEACDRRFTVDDGFLGMWYGKRAVTKAIDLHYEGLSTRQVAGYFARQERFKPSWTSVWR